MRLSNLYQLILIILFCCSGLQNMKAEITDLCTASRYFCANDGSGIVVIIVTGYQSESGAVKLVHLPILTATTFPIPAIASLSVLQVFVREVTPI